MACVPYSDLIASGSKNSIKLWQNTPFTELKEIAIEGFVNAMCFGKRNPHLLVLGVGQEPKMGRWEKVQAKNGVKAIKFE